MKTKITLTISLLVLAVSLNAQVRAYTETGDTIYVYNDGTWSYDDEILTVEDELGLDLELDIDTSSVKYTSPASSKKQVNNINGQFILKYDDKIWKRVPPASLNEDAEFAFQGKNFDAWGLVISEDTQFPPDNLFRIAKKQMEQNLRAEAEIVKVEMRNVNGYDLIQGVLRADFGGAPIIFNTYYYSDSRGSVQVIVYASESVLNKNSSIVEDLLNGFEITE